MVGALKCTAGGHLVTTTTEGHRHLRYIELVIIAPETDLEVLIAHLIHEDRTVDPSRLPHGTDDTVHIPGGDLIELHILAGQPAGETAMVHQHQAFHQHTTEHLLLCIGFRIVAVVDDTPEIDALRHQVAGDLHRML